MSDPNDQKTYHLTSHAPSGGNATNGNGGMHCCDRGRYRACQSKNSNVNRMDESRFRGQLEVCPTQVATDVGSVCSDPASSYQEPKPSDTPKEDGHVSHDNSGERPEESTNSQVQGESVPESDYRRVGSCSGGGLLDARLGKKKHRRRPSKKKRRWKPYYKLSWEEKKELDERETARASRVRAEMFAKGLPVAPYNTTQFIMEEHDREEPDLNTELGGRRSLGVCPLEESASDDDCLDAEDEDECSGAGSDGMGRPGSAGGAFLQRDFSETYERYHVESLQNMTKQELVQEYLELEKCMSRLEEENNRLRCAGGRPYISATQPDASLLKQLEMELEKVRAQNSELRKQNQLYREAGLALPLLQSNNGANQEDSTKIPTAVPALGM